jgi:hypothetical protein
MEVEAPMFRGLSRIILPVKCKYLPNTAFSILGTITSYAHLIHEEMPLNYGELRNSAKLSGDMRRQILNREAALYVPNTVSVDVDNTSLDVEAQNGVQVTGSVSIER